jgi:hypothetical protein
MARMSRPKRPDSSTTFYEFVGPRVVPSKAVMHKGMAITKESGGRWATPGIRWGEGPGEFLTYKTLKEAKASIARQAAEGWTGASYPPRFGNAPPDGVWLSKGRYTDYPPALAPGEAFGARQAREWAEWATVRGKGGHPPDSY